MGLILLCCIVKLSIATESELKASDAPRFEVLNGPKIARFGAEHGLSKYMSDLAIDRQGYVWVATIDGLARYDGTGFRHWRHQPGQADSLPVNNVLSVAVDVENHVWAATSESLSILDRDRRRFRNLNFYGEDNRCSNSVAVIAAAEGAGVWAGTYDGHLCSVTPDGKVKSFAIKTEKIRKNSAIIPVVLLAISAQEVLIGTDRGLFRFKDEVFSEIGGSIIGDALVFSIYQRDNGEEWVSTDRGLFNVSERGAVVEVRRRPDEIIMDSTIIDDGSGGYWFGTRDGLFHAKSFFFDGLIRIPSKKERKIKNDISYSSNLSELSRVEGGALIDGVYTMKVDLEGGLWVLGNSSSLVYMPASKSRFSSVRYADIQGSKTNGIVSIAKGSDGEAFLLTKSRLYQLDKNSLNVVVADHRADNFSDSRAVRVCDNGRVWVADRNGMKGFDKKKNIFFDIGFSEVMGSQAMPQNLFCSADGVWLSLYGGGLNLYSHQGVLTRSLSPESTAGRVRPGFVDLVKGPDGRPWLTDDYDLRRWDNSRFVKLYLPRQSPITAFAFESSPSSAKHKIVWVARFGVLERYSWDGTRLRLQKKLGLADGLPMSDIDGLMVTPGGKIWMTTVRGLVLYDQVRARIRTFSVRDGLQGNDFIYGSPIMLSPNRAIALSTDGVAIFDPELSLPEPKPSLLAIESLTLRRDRGEIALDPNEPVVMRAGDRDLRIVSRLLSFSDLQSHRYRSRLHGEDPDWVVQNGTSERVFSTLPQGRYSFEIQAANADGAWSMPVSLQVEVQPPWWRSAWAMVLYTLLASALLWWFSYLDQLRLKRRHTYQLARQKRELAEQASEAKSRFLADLGHELRTPMTGVLGMSELLLDGDLQPRQYGQAQSIRRAGEHLLRLIDDALDLAKIEAGRLELQTVEFALSALLDEVAALMSPLAARKGLRFAVTREPDIHEIWLGDPLRLKQILLNLLGNAVKFTERGEVGLQIEAISPGDVDRPFGEGASEHTGLRLIVRDTGPGMDAEQLQRLFRRFEQAEGARTAARYGGTGLGLAISRELAFAMGGTIDVRSALGRGSEFDVSLPLKKADAVAPQTVDGSVTSASLPSQLPPSPLAPTDWQVILLVEDDPTVAEVLVGLLQRQGHRVVHAPHGLAAMTEAALGRFDLALIDLDLPGIDGCALAGQLRANGFAAPMLAITARADAEAEPQALAAGFLGFLRKPTTGERLQGAIVGAVSAETAAPPNVTAAQSESASAPA